MAMLKAVLESIDDLDETLKPFYAENDGKYYLQVEGVNDHPDVANLRNAYQSEKTKRQKQGQELADALAKLEAKPNPTKADDAEILRLREALEAERDTWKTKATELEGTVYKLTVESQLDIALRNSGVTNPSLTLGAKALLQGKIKVVDGKPVADTDMGPMPLAEYVKRWASSEGAAYVSPPQGGGANGNKGPGAAVQKKPEEMTVHERKQLLTDDPDAFYKAFPQAKLR